MSQTPKKTEGLLAITMTPWLRFLIGGAGALAPVVVNILVVDMQSLFADMARDPRGAAFLVLEYVIKVVVLFILGGVVAFLHDEEVKPTKLFQLGLGAPALVLSTMNGLAVGDLKTENQRVAAVAAHAESMAAYHAVSVAPTEPVAACSPMTPPEAPLAAPEAPKATPGPARPLPDADKPLPVVPVASPPGRAPGALLRVVPGEAEIKNLNLSPESPGGAPAHGTDMP